jgi:tetratricopeptide (TPR) repeat protein
MAAPARAQQDSLSSIDLDEVWRLAEAKRFDSAAEMLRDHLARVPTDAESRSILARVLSWGKHYPESIAEYQTLLTDHPERAADHAGFARVLTWSGHIEAALPEFRRAIALDSTDVDAQLDYARAMSWLGDLPGASMEYRRILNDHPAQGDAWLGYATVARWRSGATASDRFLTQAEAHGAENAAAAEERAAVRAALAPALGGGYTTEQERQYVAGPDYTLESRGPFTRARLTVGHAADLDVRASWLYQSERAEAGTLNYDLGMRVVRADLSLLRGYPFQAQGGIEARHVTPGDPAVDYPLLQVGDFVGWNLRAWSYLGRFTPSLGGRREFVPIKAPGTVPELKLGHQSVADGTLAWQWSGRGTVNTGLERGSYSDGNARTTGKAGTVYRLRVRQPSLAIDYGFSYTDFDTTSDSYFTPLASARHAAGIGVEGYTKRFGLTYGARYEFASIHSDNFSAIGTHTWSGQVNAADLGPIGLGLDGAFSRDNNDYRTWSFGIHAAAHW